MTFFRNLYRSNAKENCYETHTKNLRRYFIKKTLSASTAITFGCPLAFGSNRELERTFDNDYSNKTKLTYEELFKEKYDHYIDMMEQIGEQVGREKLIDLLENSIEKIKGVKPNVTSNSLQDFIDPILSSEMIKNVVDVEDKKYTKYVCELKVHNCLWANTFKAKNAGDIGHASRCHGDFAEIEAFNPDLELVREKTLMQGKDSCHMWYRNKNKG